jgi:tetratricopeptide (TPR) repeat protein
MSSVIGLVRFFTVLLVIVVMGIQPVQALVPTSAKTRCNNVRDSLREQWKRAERTGNVADWSQAATSARQLLECDAVNELRARHWLAEALRKADRLAVAEKVSEQLARSEINTSADSLYTSYVKYAGYLAAYAQGRNEAAKDFLAQASQFDPQTSTDWTAQVRMNYALSHVATGEYDPARDILRSLYARVERLKADGDTLNAYRRGRILKALAHVTVWEGVDTRTKCRCQSYHLSQQVADSLHAQLDTAERLHRKSGHPQRISLLHAYRAGLDLLRSRHASAEQNARRAVKTAEELDYPWSAVSGRLMLARIGLANGALEDAQSEVAHARAILDSTQSEDADLIRQYYGAVAHRLAARIHHARGQYARMLVALWKLRVSDAPSAQRHFAVAEASTVPLTETTSGVAGAFVLLLLGAGFVVRRARRKEERASPSGAPEPSAGRGDGLRAGDVASVETADGEQGDGRRAHPGVVPVASVRAFARRVDGLHHGPPPDTSDVRVDGPWADQTAGAWSLRQHPMDWDEVGDACQQLTGSVWKTPSVSGTDLRLAFTPVQDVDRARESESVVCPVTHREHDATQRGSGTTGRAVHVHADMPFPHLEWKQYDDDPTGGSEGDSSGSVVVGRVYVPVDPSTLHRGRDAVLTAFLNYLDERVRRAALDADLVASALDAVRSLSQLTIEDAEGGDESARGGAGIG